MTSEHILIVEDEPKIAKLLSDYFEAEGYRCSLLERGDEVAGFVAMQKPDLILLDLQLPGLNGLDVCRELRENSDIPIIMVTARVDEIDRLLGLELGADDYICKPFSPREVVARTKAVLRRAHPRTRSTGLGLGRLTMDLGGHRVLVDKAEVSMTPVEFELLKLFLAKPHDVFSRAQLLAGTRGSKFEGYERNMDTHVKNLRRKLRDALGGEPPFRTVYGVGYALNQDAFLQHQEQPR